MVPNSDTKHDGVYDISVVETMGNDCIHRTDVNNAEIVSLLNSMELSQFTKFISNDRNCGMSRQRQKASKKTRESQGNPLALH